MYNCGGGWHRKEELGNPWLLCHDEGSFPLQEHLCCMSVGWLAAFVIFTPESTAGLQNCCGEARVSGVGKEGCSAVGRSWVFHRQWTLTSRSILGHLLSHCLFTSKIKQSIYTWFLCYFFENWSLFFVILTPSVKVTLTIPFCMSKKWVGVFFFLHSSCTFAPNLVSF